MSTAGQFSSKNPTIKRILKEASELANAPSSDYHAAPLETDLFEWHFTLRGPPPPSSFAGGLYHGRIVLPPAYPLKPPSFRFLTPTGRFEVNREICLSISGHHEESWQPAWGIRTALVAIRSFMDTDAKGQLGGMDASKEVRERFAVQSPGWKCPACAKSNQEIMVEQDEVVKEAGGEQKAEEAVPEELRLQFREDLGKRKEGEVDSQASVAKSAELSQPSEQVSTPTPTTSVPPRVSSVESPPAAAGVAAAAVPQQQRQQPQRQVQQSETPAWIDKAILGIIAALVLLVARKVF
ncbi:hypothetical protein MBLNU230_g0227t1 [Neophaeotheca triangularis]